MKKKTLIISAILTVIILCGVIVGVRSFDESKRLVFLYWVEDVMNPNIDVEYVDPNPEENTLDLIEFAEELDFTDINDETLSELAKISLSLFEKYDKILIRRIYYTDNLERMSVRNSPTDNKTSRVVVYCENAKNAQHALVYLGLLIELFNEDMYFGDMYWLENFNTINRNMAPYLCFSTNYKKMGYKTIEDYRIAKEKLSDEITVVKNDELFDRELAGTPLTENETEKLQKLKEKRDELLGKEDKLNEGLYEINFHYFKLDKVDDNIELVEGEGYVDHSEWKTVSEIAEMK